jgi:aryl-alcohol dehydrogenase-like predicted oxidoreductase
MRYDRFGNTGLVVSELCFGATTFGENSSRFPAIAGLAQDRSAALTRRVLDAQRISPRREAK